MSNKELLAWLFEFLGFRYYLSSGDESNDSLFYYLGLAKRRIADLLRTNQSKRLEDLAIFTDGEIARLAAVIAKQDAWRRIQRNVRDRGYDFGPYPRACADLPRPTRRRLVGSSTLRNRRGVTILRLDGEGRLIISKRAKRMLGGRRGAGCYSREEVWRDRPDRVAERELREELERYFFRREDALLQYEHFFEIPSEWHEMLGVETAMQIARSRCSLHRLCESEE